MNKQVIRAISKLVSATSEKPLLVTPGEAAQMLGCSRTTIYALIKRKALRTAKIGSDRNRVLVASIEAYCENGGDTSKSKRRAK